MARIDFTVPVKWDELSAWQRDKIGRILFKKEAIESDLFRSLMVMVLFVPTPTLKNLYNLFRLLRRIPVKQLWPYADFLFDQEQFLYTFHPSFKVNGVVLIGPAARLSNISIHELSYADAFYYKWVTDQQDVDLHRLCAVLYRPEDQNRSRQDKREPFDPLLLNENAELTDKIPLHQKYMIAMAYMGCRALFAKRYTKVFPKPKKTADTPESPQLKKQYWPFTNLINAMALDETSPFGTVPETEQANADKFLAIYQEQLIRQQKREAEAEKMKTKSRRRP